MMRCLIAFIALGLASASPAFAQSRLLFSVFLPPAHFLQATVRQWAADVEKATEGRVKIEFSAGSLAPPPQQMNAVQSGIFDIGVVANIFIKNKAPLIEFSTLPWLILDAEAASVGLWRTYEKSLAGKKQFTDVQLLSLFHFGAGHVYSTTDTPINSIEELKKRKMWALPGEAADLLKNLGISPVTSPAVQVSETVSRGVVDGVYGITLESLTDFKAAPYLKVLTLFPRGATSTSFSMFINKDKWSQLPERDRAAILSLSGEKMAARVGKAADKAAADALVKMKADGIKAIDADSAFYADLQKAAANSYTRFEGIAAKNGVDGKALLDEFRNHYQALAKQ
ncbi:MAG: TRAP transporter substrate-binding protein DctP [Burkholderiales bacterium]